MLIVDDHPVVRAGLAGILAGADGLEVVGEAGSGEEAIARVPVLRPDVVLMDLRMPGCGGAEATRRVAGPDCRVVVLTTYETDVDILRAVEAGAVGYLLKDSPGIDLVAAIRAADRGETVLAPSVAARLAANTRSPATETLSPREIEVLGLVADGLSNPDIGRRLHIAEATVKTHLLRAYAKLGVTDRTAAVTTAIRRGILRL